MKKDRRNIDNTAKIFSLDFIKNANVFRVSVILKDKIKKDILKQAVDKSLDSYSSFKVKLKSGLFWDYFEYNDKEFIVKKAGRRGFNRFNYYKNNGYLIKVRYYRNKINIDFFHMLTDGVGALNFIKSVISNYLDLLNGTDYNLNEKKYNVSYQDEFLKNYEKASSPNNSAKNIYLIKEKMKRGTNNTYHYTVNVDDIKKISKKYNATITEYLAALYIYSIYNSLYDKNSNKEIALTIPIDIRKHFNVDTLSNFFVCMKINPKIHENNLTSFDEIIDSVKKEFKMNLTEENIKKYLASDVRLGRNLGYRYVPSFIKKFFMGHFGKYFGGSTTSTLSNLGPINIDERYVKYIDNIYTIVMPGRIQKVKCTICSFNNKLNITMNSNIDDFVFEKEFYRLLKEDISDIELSNNTNIKY
ncbi:MAG: hypothetical protein IJN90_07890 [Bacilli bacterium]|nr:hypothetical protein [Bacilli bacterium]